MFSHLDDPQPPTPGAALADRLVAEGRGRRRRRTRLAAGTVAVVVLVGGGVVLRPWDVDGTEQGVIAEGGSTTTTVPEDTTTSTTAVAPGGSALETVVVPGAWPTGPVFAGITIEGDVVLADPGTGEVLLTLLAANPLAPAVDVALTEARDAVYVGTLFDYRGGPLLRLRPGEPVAVLGTADAVAVSPDGGLLATIAGEGYRTDEVRVLDAESGAVLSSTSLAELLDDGDLYVRDVAWDRTGERLLVEAGFPEAGSELYFVEPERSAERVGPPSSRADGTGWALGGPLTDQEVLITETCCSLDANSYETDSALLVIDVATGVEQRRIRLDGGYARVAVGPAGAQLVLTQCCGSPDARLLDGNLQPLGGPVYQAVDW